MKVKLIVIDVETTGLDPARHGLAAVAALDMDDGQLFYSAVRPHRGADVSDEALAVNGLSREALLVAPTEGQVMSALGRWLSARAPFLPAGVNPRFDIDFLRAAEARSARRQSAQAALSLPTLPTVANSPQPQAKRAANTPTARDLYRALSLPLQQLVRAELAAAGATWLLDALK